MYTVPDCQRLAVLEVCLPGVVDIDLRVRELSCAQTHPPTRHVHTHGWSQIHGHLYNSIIADVYAKSQDLLRLYTEARM